MVYLPNEVYKTEGTQLIQNAKSQPKNPKSGEMADGRPTVFYACTMYIP